MTATLKNFFPEPKNVAYEVPCEYTTGACSPDMLSFKGYVHRWLAVVTQVAPFTKDTILPILKTSAEAAVAQCTGGTSGRVCGFYWSGGSFVDPSVDETTGAGEQMNVLAAVSSLLIEDASPPVTNSSGGISTGNPKAGDNSHDMPVPRALTTADRAGAGILTFVMLSMCIGAFTWMCAFD